MLAGSNNIRDSKISNILFINSCPTSALFLYLSEKDKNILEKIDSLNDVKIIDSLCISEGLDRLKMVIEKGYQAVVLQKPEGESLEDILKYCYACGTSWETIPSIPFK